MKTLWTPEDFQPQVCVAAIIKGDGDKILIQKHNKLNKWTMPIGKAKPNDVYSITMCKELKEECGITVIDLDLIGSKVITVERNNIPMNVPTYFYLVKSYLGEILNVEKDKHSIQEFMDPKELADKGEPLTFALQIWLNELKNKTNH